MARLRILTFSVVLAVSACTSLDGLLGGGKNGLPTEADDPTPAQLATRPDGAPLDTPDPVDGGAGPSPDGGTVVDDGCDVDDPFTTIVPLKDLNSTTLDGTPRLSPDELSIYFVSAVGNSDGANWDLWSAKRSKVSDAFGAPEKLAGANGTLLDTDGTLTADELTLFFTSFRAESGQLRLFRATRATKTGAFSPPTEISVGHVVGTNDQAPIVSPDGAFLYFASNRAGGQGGFDLLRAPLSPAGVTGVPERIDNLGVNSASDDSQIALTGNGLAAYVTSNRPGGSGEADIWVFKRPSPTAPFGSPRNVKELNTPFSQGVGWVSPDACRIYFANSTGTGLAALASMDLYVASRTKTPR